MDPGVRVDYAMQHFVHEPFRRQQSLWEVDEAEPTETETGEPVT